MPKPTYEELVACICDVAGQHYLRSDYPKKDVTGNILRTGERFDHQHLSSGESVEWILHALDIIDDDGFLVGPLPLGVADVESRLKQLPAE